MVTASPAGTNSRRLIARERAAAVAPLRAALIRLLWNAVADDESCDGDCEKEDDTPFAVCEAMRALGWGEHFTKRKFMSAPRRPGDRR